MLQFTLRIDALFEHFKQSANKISQMCQSKSYTAPPRFNKKEYGWLVQLYWNSRLIRPCVKLVGSSRNCPFRSTCIRENDGASCEITASVPSIDHAHSRFLTCMVILYTLCDYSFLRRTLSVTPLRNLPVNKRKFGWVQLIAKSSSMYTKICLCPKLRTSWGNWC